MLLDQSHPNVFEYHDYRTYLRDAFARKHAKNPAWTTVAWSRQLKLSAPSTLSMILNHRRHPGKKVMESLIQYFQFNSAEANYFSNLVGLQKKMGNRRLTVHLVNSLLENSEKKNLKDTPALLRRNTYVLREMTRLADFSEDVNDLQKRIIEAAEPSELRSLLSELEQQKLVTRSPEGHLQGTAAIVARDAPPTPEEIERFHTELLDATRNALRRVPKDERLFHSTFLSVKKGKIEEARRLVLEFQKKFSELLEATPGDEVFQLNVHFFPATLKR